MRQHKPISYFLTAAIAVLAVSAATAQHPMPTTAVSPAKYAPAVTSLPIMPVKLDFAGERVPLENYDTRESLEKELSVTMYMHSRTLQTLLNTTRYLPMIEPILEKNGIPADFKYLCMAESGLNPNIESTAGAAGLWQLMPSVAKDKGMVAGGGVDERYHIEKATQAACDYLRTAYGRFGSWTMAAASYNLGMAGLAKRVEKQQGMRDYYDIFLPEETLRYVFRILSWKLVLENPQHYGFSIPPEKYHKPLVDYREVEVGGKPIDWSKAAADNGTTYKMLRELNHWIRDYEYANTAGKVFKVKIPKKGFREQ